MLIAICVLVLLAYLFDVTSSKTKVPTVIWLILLGFGTRQLMHYYDITSPDLANLLPLLGTVGLILIVLDGSLELELNKGKLKVLGQTMGLATVGMFVSIGILAVILHYIGGIGWRTCILNAIPLSVISSAIAVPSVQGQPAALKEFVIYETSFSDILGVLLFNFVLLNTSLSVSAVGVFSSQLIIVIILSAIGTAGLAILLRYVNHHIKFIPILVLVVLLYAVEKHFHLPALIFILVFGLFLANLDKIKWRFVERYLHPQSLSKEVDRLHKLLIEASFLIRSLFFILLGFTLQQADLLDVETLGISILVVTLFILGRAALLLLMRKPLLPLLFVAPRGLITILLFISIPATMAHPWVNNALLVQVILLMVLVMMLGLMFAPKRDEKPIEMPAEAQEA